MAPFIVANFCGLCNFLHFSMIYPISQWGYSIKMEDEIWCVESLCSGAKKPPLEGRWRAKRDGEVLGQLRFPQASPQRTAVTPLSHGALRHASSPQGEPWVRCGRRTWVGIGGLRTANVYRVVT